MYSYYNCQYFISFSLYHWKNLKPIRSLDSNKATDSDAILGQILLLCDDSDVLPLEIIFQYILNESIYRDIWTYLQTYPLITNRTINN